jgi:hypothetical protein
MSAIPPLGGRLSAMPFEIEQVSNIFAIVRTVILCSLGKIYYENKFLTGINHEYLTICYFYYGYIFIAECGYFGGSSR